MQSKRSEWNNEIDHNKRVANYCQLYTAMSHIAAVYEEAEASKPKNDTKKPVRLAGLFKQQIQNPHTDDVKRIRLSDQKLFHNSLDNDQFEEKFREAVAELIQPLLSRFISEFNKDTGNKNKGDIADLALFITKLNNDANVPDNNYPRIVGLLLSRALDLLGDGVNKIDHLKSALDENTNHKMSFKEFKQAMDQLETSYKYNEKFNTNLGFQIEKFQYKPLRKF